MAALAVAAGQHIMLLAICIHMYVYIYIYIYIHAGLAVAAGPAYSPNSVVGVGPGCSGWARS